MLTGFSTAYGEIVSRASRSRRTDALDAMSDTEGYHLDWLFTVNTGQHAASAKDDARHASHPRPYYRAGRSATVVRAFDELMIPGFISSRYFIRVLLNLYIGAGYHISRIRHPDPAG
ncbi:hypothetical protein BC937DRAFT_87055 [Endogone sp. FLAS-F59071]|nr:hypothetical protein BC937DRAFT_87055 [Endogone sp. FLAS-F59071]|eukprot:RUS12781.1 hypothetical protein BC937DRAFT_87055 [Endogone sp. FLAS-F59071]